MIEYQTKEYIDKEALKRDLIDNRNFYPAIVKAAIESAPVAEVKEVIHAEWLFNRHGGPCETSYYCSRCIDGGSDYGSDNYCPNCGAIMKGNGGTR